MNGISRRAATAAATIALAASAFAAVAPAAHASSKPQAKPPATAQNGPGASSRVRSLCPRVTHPGEVGCTVVQRVGAREAAGAPPAGYGPADLRSAYQLPAAPAGGGTPTVAVIAPFDDPNAESDLAVYRTQFGLPACVSSTGCFTKADENGGTTYPFANSYWASQDALDLDVVSAVCPACKLLLVEVNSNEIDDLGAGVNTAVKIGANVVEVAGSFEEPNEQQLDAQYFDHPGIPITTPAGDFGYSGDTAVPYPGVSPYVTSVGGTSLVPDPDSPRGWDESVYNDASGFSATSSGCSAYEPKPAYQHDSGCKLTTANDVAAVADPVTGIAAYDSYQASGWAELGGTGGAASLVAAVYALAGNASAASSPKSWPYAARGALNDITSGSDGNCLGSELCTAGPGYDGPTGMGTPRGVLAFEPPARHGDITGTVTDARTGKPLDDAAVSAGGVTVYTSAAGTYDLVAATGAVRVHVSAFGHDAKTVSAVTGTRLPVALSPMPATTLSGTITDAGHGWPVYAKIIVRGMPHGTFYDSQATGRYQVTVPRGVTQTLEVSPVYPGYQPTVVSVPAATGQHVSLRPDASTCTAPGYAYKYQGLFQDFGASPGSAAPAARSLSARSLSARAHVASSGPPPGWTVTDGLGTGRVWAFNDPGQRGNLTGGAGGFAIEDGQYYGYAYAKDTTLTSPVVDLSGVASPAIGFDTDLFDFSTATATVDLSIDGGKTWQNIWQQTQNVRHTFVQIPVPRAANASAVQVRFHYTSSAFAFDDWWQVDNVFVGLRTCSALTGGLLTGTVADKNTGAALANASVSGAGDVAGTTARSGALPSGRYWMFVPSAGSRAFTASNGPLYQRVVKNEAVAAGRISVLNFALPAGRLRISTTSVASRQVLGSTVTKTVRITNTGTAAASVALAPYTASSGVVPAASAWRPIPASPVAVIDPAAAYGNGLIYSVAGMKVNPYTGAGTVIANGYVYNPATRAWRAIAPIPYARHGAAAAFIGGKLYVAGGLDQHDAPVSSLEIYNPRTNTWVAGHAPPAAFAAAGVAVVGTTMYLIGGCEAAQCGTQDVAAYDAATDRWHTAAPNPVPVGWEGCGAIGGQVYCGGGLNVTQSYKSGYAYNPAKNSWRPIADMPIDLYGGGAVPANGALVLDGGLTEDGHVLTNAAFGYDPGSDSWSVLPGLITPIYRGGTACGIYQIGGISAGSGVVANSSVLPGFGQCGGPARLPWLSLSKSWLTIRPGASVTLRIRFSSRGLRQPGVSSATLRVSDNTPYPVPGVRLRLTMTPPKGWALVTGVVSGRACTGAVSGLAAATVQIDGSHRSFTVTTDARGRYSYWLDARNSPVKLIVALGGWQPQTRTVRITAGHPSRANFLLKRPVCH